MKILLIFLLFENSINKIEAGKIKEAKSFDQIFGQRWDERTEENICPIDQINHGETAEQNQNDHQQSDQFFDEDLEVKEDEREEMSTNCDQMEQLPENGGQICDQIRILNDKQKREIVEKFHKIKEKIKQRGKKYSTKEWIKIERKIAKKLGTNQKKIYEWKREFGLNNLNKFSDEEKLKILNQFDQIYGKLKKKLKEKLEGNGEKCKKILAKHLGISIKSIYQWKKQFQKGKPIKNQKNDDEKREIVEKYLKIKNEFMQNRKHSRNEWEEFKAKMKQMFGVGYSTIKRWAKNLGIEQNNSKKRKQLTIAEKMEMMKQFYKIKIENPSLKDAEIAAKLEMPTSSLKKYKWEFENGK